MTMMLFFIVGSFLMLMQNISSAQEVTVNDTTTTLTEVVVTAPSAEELHTGTVLNSDQLEWRVPASSDAATLLQDAPGISLRVGGGVSSLPAIHGLADDRLNIQVNGVNLLSACPNHMNTPLSYIDPSNVNKVEVFAGVTPVSVGGDSIGGTVLVESAPPAFAESGQGLLSTGQIGGFYRSNGDAYGGNLGATLANEHVNLSYKASSAQSKNYRAADDFKPAGPSLGETWLDGDTVGSSSYKSENQEFGIATRYDNHLLDMKVNVQRIPYEGFPNQRMDLTDNNNTNVTLGYTGQYVWGALKANAYNQKTSHAMDFGEDKQFWYAPAGGASIAAGMPMKSRGKNVGGTVKADIILSEQNTLSVGGDVQNYTLNDWWPPSGGKMAPNTFWNIRDGHRDRFDMFAEWESQWTAQFSSLIGVRSDIVRTDTGNVVGYDNSIVMNQKPDADAFNNRDHEQTDYNWDLTALARYTATDTQAFEVGYARKTRSPNLYERYSWSSATMMMLMNNFIGDGNGYLGNIDLEPEVAHTFSITTDWHDAANELWGLKATPYYTYIEDYIDAQRCPIGTGCYSVANSTTRNNFVNLQYVNQTAQLYGIDVSTHMLLGSIADYGSFTATGLLNYTRGENRTTHDNLYGIMPLNTKLALVHNLHSWTNTAELQLVASKSDVSATRNEIETGGYGLFNLRSSYTWKNVRFDIGVDNLLDRAYASPLGGAYVGQGKTMSITGVPWGVAVPGMGRSINTGINITF